MKYLSNEPIGEDLFASQAQNKIADVISSNISELRMIGIEGPWGSGKSNLVKILEKKLLENSKIKYHFFIYDSWAHQTDYQKRALIEEIGEYLSGSDRQIINAQEFEDSRRDALGTLIVTTTASKVTFTWATMFVVLSLIFTPISSSVASVYDNWYWITFWRAMPTILVVISLIICAIKGSGISKIKDQFVEAFNKSGQETSKREYKNTEDPSTFSMRNFFKVIDSKMPNDDLLVVVVDNLDRLPQDKVQDVWTMIQSCFNDVTLRFDRIKVIVPFDRKHLKVCQDKEGDRSYIDDYIDKTFDMVFRVPSPVLNDWKDYFDKQWKSVFNNAESDIINRELDLVKLIFDAFNTDITPRGINSFINSMWRISLFPDLEKIKYRYKAIFVCKQSDILQNPLKAMTDLKYLTPLDKYFEEDDEFCMSIAALAYVAPLNRGEEIALIRPLESALSAGDSESIKKIVSVPSFASILEKVLEKNGNNKLLDNYVLALHDLSEDDFGGPAIYKNRWDTLYTFLNDRKYQLSSSGELYVEEFQLKLLEHITPVQQHEMAMKIIESLNKTTDIAKFVSSIDALNETLSKHDINVFDMLQHKNVSFDKAFMDFVRKYGVRFSEYKIGCDEKDVDDYYCKNSVQLFDNSDLIPALLKNGYELSNFRKILIDEINSQIPYERFIVVWKVFLVFIKNTDRSYKIVKKISIMPNDLDTYMARALGNNDPEMCGELLCLAISKFTFSSLDSCPHIYGNLNDIKYSDAVSAFIHKFIKLDDYLLKYNDYKTSKLYSQVCKDVVANNEEWYADIDKIIPHIQNIVETIKLDDGEFLEFLSNWEIEEFDNELDIKKTITLDFLKYSSSFDDDFSSSCREKVRQYLDNLSEEDWQEAFEANEADYEIKASRIVKFKWSVHAWNAVRRYLLELLGDDEVPEDTELWLEIISDIEKTRSLGNFLGTVADMIASKTLSIEMFKFWGILFSLMAWIN